MFFSSQPSALVISPSYAMRLLRYPLLLAFLLPSLAFAQSTATYRMTFESVWSADTHPVGFPPNPHYSPLIGAAHSASASLWEVGSLASPGIEQMAETGGTSQLRSEINGLIGDGTARSVLSGAAINSPGSTSFTFDLTEDHALVSLVTMVAPSPDWFVGVSGLDLREGGAWVAERVVELYAYDAGTDSGASYTSPNQNTNPAEAIVRLEESPFVVGGALTPLGTFTFQRLNAVTLAATNATSLAVAPGGSVSFDYTVMNGTAAAVSGDLFYTATPGGVSGTIASGRVNAGQSVSGSYTQNIPATAPAGTYTYTLRVGQFPSTTRGAQAFTVTVLPAARVSDADAWSVSGATPWGQTVVASSEDAPSAVALDAAYPNPFAATTTLGFDLSAASEVTLEVLDVLGRRVAVLAEGAWEAGSHSVAFDGRGLPGGTYLVRLEADSGFAQMQRVTLVR